MTCLDCGGDHLLVEHFEIGAERRVRRAGQDPCPAHLANILRVRAVTSPPYRPGPWFWFLPSRQTDSQTAAGRPQGGASEPETEPLAPGLAELQEAFREAGSPISDAFK